MGKKKWHILWQSPQKLMEKFRPQKDINLFSFIRPRFSPCLSWWMWRVHGEYEAKEACFLLPRTSCQTAEAPNSSDLQSTLHTPQSHLFSTAFFTFIFFSISLEICLFLVSFSDLESYLQKPNGEREGVRAEALGELFGESQGEVVPSRWWGRGGGWWSSGRLSCLQLVLGVSLRDVVRMCSEPFECHEINTAIYEAVMRDFSDSWTLELFLPLHF